MDTITRLGPEFLGRMDEMRKHLEKVSSDLEALIESILPIDTDLKRRVTVRLQQAGEEIERVLDHIDAAESTASGSSEPDSQL